MNYFRDCALALVYLFIHFLGSLKYFLATNLILIFSNTFPHTIHKLSTG